MLQRRTGLTDFWLLRLVGLYELFGTFHEDPLQALMGTQSKSQAQPE